MVVSPDVGGVVRARGLAKRIDVPIAICDKRRERAGESEVMNVIGEVKGKRCILIDDIVDSGGTLVNAANALLQEGATEVMAYITHGVLSGGAVAKITEFEPQDAGDHRLDPADRGGDSPPPTSACSRSRRCWPRPSPAPRARKASPACSTERDRAGPTASR